MTMKTNSIENLAMANCLMLRLSQSGSSPISDRVFHCKTCNKPFRSFQALGGHRAGHRRPRLMDNHKVRSPAKAKTHECSICGVEFAIGQALGGHMRRHRDGVAGKRVSPAVMEKSECNSGFCLDLNLTPHENDMKRWLVSI